MKLLAAVILLENRLADPGRLFDCRGRTDLRLTNGRAFHCSHPHGQVTLAEALAVSCNAYFAKAIVPITVPQFVSSWQAFFPGKPIDRALNKESLPFCLLGCDPMVSLSAGDLLGWMQRLANREKSGVGAYAFEALRQGMRMAARSGTGQKADPDDQYRLALKTGTAKYGNRYRSWVAGYFPFEAPQFVFCVRAVNGTSEEKAVPMLRALLEQYGKVRLG